MTSKASRALKAALAIGAVAVLSLSLVAMSACSANAPAGHATKNVMGEPEATVTPMECSETLDAVAYMNYTLAQQDSWHSEKKTDSTSVLDLGIMKMTVDTTTTRTQKDYKDGVLVTEESVYSSTYKGSSHQFMFETGEDDRVAYVRGGFGPESADDEISSITWDDETAPECWSEDYYNTQYGLFMDEISLYVLNEETLLYTYDEDGEVIDNGCGKVTYDEETGYYSQTFTLDTENSIYYYQYSMMTHGNLGSAPEFSSVEVTFTFDSNWRVWEIQETDVATVTAGAVNTSETTTTFEYGDSAIDTETFEAACAFFEPYVGTLEMVDIEVDETEGDEDGKLASQDVEYTQYEKNLTLTIIMAAIVGVVIILGIILTGVGCSAGKNAEETEEKKKDGDE